MRKQLAKYIQPFFIALACAFIAVLLARQWDQLRSYPWRLHGGWLALSTLCMMASWALEIAIWRRLLHLVGGELSYWPAARIWFLSAVVRYVPGNVWQPLSMTLRCRRRGIPFEATLTSVLLYQVVVLLAVAPIAAIYFQATGNFGLLTAWLRGVAPELIGLSLAPVLLFLARPDWLIRSINWVLRRMGRPLLEVQLSSIQLVGVLFMAVVDWGLWGAAFATITFALTTYTPHELPTLTPHLVATYSIAYAIGFLSLITPSGFGVREGALYVLLAPLLGGGAATVAALASRMWTMLGEVVAAAVSMLVEWRLSPEPLSPQTSPAAASLQREA